MKLEKILLGRAIRLLRFTGRPLYMPDVTKSFVDQYKFLKFPQTLEDFDPAKGITFQHGKLSSGGKDIIIDSFQIYNNGLLADTRDDAENADIFLDNIIEWGTKTFGQIITDQSIENVYLSNLEISLSNLLPTYAPVSKQLDAEISRYLTEYGLKHAPFELTSLVLNYDKTRMPDSVLSNFTLQRRDGMPFDSGRYYSTAPLKTKDHIALLQKIDS